MKLILFVDDLNFLKGGMGPIGPPGPPGRIRESYVGGSVLQVQ